MEGLLQVKPNHKRSVAKHGTAAAATEEAHLDASPAIFIFELGLPLCVICGQPTHIGDTTLGWGAATHPKPLLPIPIEIISSEPRVGPPRPFAIM